MSDDSIKKLEALTQGLSADPFASLDIIFDRSNDILCIVNKSGYFSKVSKSFTAEFGWTEEQLLSTPFLDLLHPDDVTPTIDCWVKTQAGHPTVDFKNRYRTASGEYKTLIWSLPGMHGGIAFSVARVEKPNE